MNFCDFKGEISNPWGSRKEFSRIPQKNLLSALLILFVCAFSIGCASLELTCLFALPILFVLMVLTVKRVGTVLLVGITALAASLLSMQLMGAVLLLAFVVGISSLSYLLTTHRMPYAVPSVFLLAMGATWLLTGQALLALLPLTLLPPAILLAVATTSGRSRTSAVCFTQIGLLLSILVVLAVVFYRAIGSLQVADITAYLSQLQENLCRAVIGVRDAMIVQAEELSTDFSMEELEKSIQEFRSILSEANVKQMIASIFAILPAVAAVVCGIIAFEAQMLLNCLYYASGWKQVLTPKSCMFTMSFSAALIYLFSFLCVLFFATESLFLVVMQNMCIILLPGFCVYGVGTMLGQFRTAKGGGKIFFILLYVAIACCAGLSALYLLALLGANTVIFGFIHQKILQKTQESEGDNQSGKAD